MYDKAKQHRQMYEVKIDKEYFTRCQLYLKWGENVTKLIQKMGYNPYSGKTSQVWRVQFKQRRETIFREHTKAAMWKLVHTSN